MTKSSIAVAALTAALAGASASAQVSGEQLFKQRCTVCHAVKANVKPMLGPNLAGVVGRKAGTTSYNYTPAMKASKLVWTPPTLDKYLTAPSKLVPGTRMVIAVSDAAQRKALIEYLKTVR